jgi:hypothetical protein
MGVMKLGSVSGHAATLQEEIDAIHERKPACLNDVFGNTDRAPVVFAIGRDDQDAGLGCRRVMAVDDANLVVDQ